MAAMMIALVWLGVYPQPVLDLAQPVLDGLHGLLSDSDTAGGGATMSRRRFHRTTASAGTGWHRHPTDAAGGLPAQRQSLTAALAALGLVLAALSCDHSSRSGAAAGNAPVAGG